MNVPDELRYTKDHEWVRTRDDGRVVIGITDYAQDALGDITYLELPKVGDRVSAGGACGVVESVKTFSDIYAPLDGEVVEVNAGLSDNEASVNESPYENGWLFVLAPDRASDVDRLLDAEAYRKVLDSE